MGGYLDVILFAALALFLIYRLGAVLGRRGDDHREGPSPFDKADDKSASTPDNVVAIPGRGGPQATNTGSMDPLEAGLTQIKAAARGFREKEFLEGARSAFEMIVEAFASGNGKTLKAILDGAVYENFAAAIRTREKAGQTLESTLVGIEKSEIIAAEMQGRDAIVTVKFITEQINVTRDADETVVEGDASHVATVTDIWTFKRNTRSSDPNWVLVATASPD